MNEKTHTGFFLWLSLAFWVAVVVLSAVWGPTYQLMKQFIQMHAEYSLLEQGSKLLLLVMLFVSLYAYSNDEDDDSIFLATLFSLFAVVLYFAESNFLVSEWQPLFGAFFIGLISWKLLFRDRLALLFMLAGAGFIFLGVISDVLLDKPELLPVTPFLTRWQSVAHLIEEQFDLWGLACFSFASLVAFRGVVTKLFAGHATELLLLMVSLGLVASGNGFAHWQYNPSPTFEVIASAMAVIGILGVSYCDRRASERGFALTHFSRDQFYVSFTLAFVVLPIVYGGSGKPFNLVLWVALFYYLGRKMIQRHPANSGS